MQILRSSAGRVQFALVLVGIFVGFAIGAADAEAQGTATFEVTNLLDSGTGSLRAAIIDANASSADTKNITFAVPNNGTINLITPLPDIEDGVRIDGSTATNLTVNGAGQTHIFRVNSDTTTVQALTLKNAPLEIGSGASLAFDGSADQQFDGVITDAGRLVKQGTATLTLRGANDYTGGTLVSAGILRGDTTSLQGGITNNATLVFDQNVGGTYSGAITGTGAVRKTGTGEVVFTGGNTYAGGTTISAGALRGDADSLQGNIAVESGGVVIFVQPANATYLGNLTGAGGFTKEGAGTLTLSGTNTISGQSSLAGGALRGGFASIPRKLSTAAGTLVTFNHDTDGTYAGAISGMAGVTKTGTGTLTLSGANTYAGVTTVSAGTLRAGSQNLPNQTTSSIVNNAALIFDSSGAGTYQGAISGTGSLTKAGIGTLSLAGINTFTGPSSIMAGRLDVNGSLGIGAVNVGASAVLGGTGSVGGPVTVNGTVAPGNSIGVLSVGAVTFAPGSVFVVEVDAPTADHLFASGTVDLGGASLQVDIIGGNYDTPLDVTILTAGAVLNDFAPFEEDFAFLDITYMKTATTVELRVADNGMTPSDYAQTPNQLTIAAALEAAGIAGTDPDIDEVFEGLDELSETQVPSALEAMTGETLTQFATTRLATAERFGQSLEARIRDHQRQGNRALLTAGTATGEEDHSPADPIHPERSPVFGVAMLGVGPMGAPGIEPNTSADPWIRTWIDGSGIYGDVDGNSNESAFDYTIWGGSLGADVLLAEHWVLGLAGGYANTDLDFSARPGEGEVDTYQGALYAGYVDPRFHVGVSARYAHNDMEGKREIRFGSIDRKADANLDGNDYGARFDGGLNLLALGEIVFQPIASVNYNHLTQDDVTESGAKSLNHALEDYDLDSLVTGVGMRVHGRWEIAAELWVVPELRGRWLHEFLDTDRLIEARLVSAPVGASAFQIQGVELPRDSGSIGLAWRVITNSAWSVVGSYDAVLNADLVQHVGSITLSFEW